MKLAFIIDPLPQLDPGHDTSVALMEAAQQLGHEVWVTQAHQLSVIEGTAWAALQRVELTPVVQQGGRWIASENWFRLSASVLTCLEAMDAVFLRVDPPVTIRYLYATYILELLASSKTLVINSPQGLREANEKMYTLQFHQVMPETIVSADKQIIRQFVEAQKAAVLKPLGGKAGEGILFLETSDRNFNSIIEISTQHEREPVMIQRYLPEARDGDKRIIIFNGEPLGAVNRVPTGQEFRGNMAVGGRVEKAEINARDAEICTAVGSRLCENGLYFVGLDVIGGYLTEVNVTSPTGIREIDLLNHTNIAKQVIERLGNC